jgi:hypothetical protein
MFFTDVNGADGSHKIYKAKMDGSEFGEFMNGLTNPTSMCSCF